MADTDTPRTSWSPIPSAASAASGPSRHATVASCSRRAGAGTRYSCGTRADATTLPSPSAAIAFTDDVPMSRPTVTSVMRRHQRREHLVVQQAVRGDRAPAVGARDAVEIGEATTGGFDDHHRRGEIPDRQALRFHRDVDRAVGHHHVGPEVAETPRAPTAPLERQDRVAATDGFEAVAVASHARCASSTRATFDTRHRLAVAERTITSARPTTAHPSAGADTTPTSRAPSRSSAMRVAHTGMPRA